ncbi:hypothetical protein RJ640_026194, partial [Escallonia rubra]
MHVFIVDFYCSRYGGAKGNESQAAVGDNKRLPLSEISMNMPSMVSVRDFKLMNSDCQNTSCKQGLSVDWISDSSSLRTAVVPAENGTVLDLFGTPIRQAECCGNSRSKGITSCGIVSIDSALTENGSVLESFERPSRHLECNLSDGETVNYIEDGFGLDSFVTPVRQLDCSNLSESLMSSGLLDEDFDDTIFEEIDALCEQKHGLVAGRQGESCNSQMENRCPGNRSGDCSTNVGPVMLDAMLETAEELRTSDGVTTQALGMPVKSNGDYSTNVLQSRDNPELGVEELRTSEAMVALPESMPEEYAKYMQSLNDRQREAACSNISIPLMIVAGPGSGKTSTMVGRILMLLNEGIGPCHILAMTFTTAAASEMRDRIGAVAGKATGKELMISTFHSFSLQLCRSHAEKLGRTPEFLIYGQGQQRRAVIEAVRLSEHGKNNQSSNSCKLGQESNGIDSPEHFKEKSKKWLKFVTQAKASGKTPEDCHKLGDETGATILRNYDNILKFCNALDYHDLISCSVNLLSDFPGVMKECQETWRAIVIDEFQDTSVMQYGLLRILASHGRITIVGDEDQSIFSFNGADVSGFISFRKDFPMHKEVRLNKNYRSTRCIVEAASSLIRNNSRRCLSKNALTDNSSGSKITVKECSSEDAQCAFVVDKVLELTSGDSSVKGSFDSIAVLYRRQVSGRMFQTSFRDRKIPFNIHGVAFYRKKVVKAIIAMLRTTLPGCDDEPFRRVFKALLPFEKEEKKRVIDHIDKISTVRKCCYISAASDIFSAKVSGTFKRFVKGEQSISAVITSVANMIPQKYLLEQRAVHDVDGRKLLNEDNDLRSVLQCLLDDVSEYLKTQRIAIEGDRDTLVENEKGCVNVLKAFIDYISERERENFRSRRHENKHSVTLTTIHQSKGLEWDTVFIVKANESEIPLLHEYNGVVKENGNSLEEERRLLYVAMTRARKKLFILYVMVDSNWQMLQPSRFLKEIPQHLQEVQVEPYLKHMETKHQKLLKETSQLTSDQLTDMGSCKAGYQPTEMGSSKADIVLNDYCDILPDDAPKDSWEPIQACNGNTFLRRFGTEERAVVSHLFHQWAKKPAFQDPKRLLGKVGFVVDERLRARKSTHKDALRDLKSCLRSDEALQYAEYVLKWEQIPADKRAYIMREKQEHFQKLRIENAMGSSAATSKQIAYLQSLGCTVVPTSRLHASHLIEQYKS